ncbi:MAG TPA: hypothetical protein VF838_06055 [Trebonia sp.]
MTIHRWRAFTVLAVAYFMTTVGLTIVNVSLPTIGRDRPPTVVPDRPGTVHGGVAGRAPRRDADSATPTPALATCGR